MGQKALIQASKNNALGKSGAFFAKEYWTGDSRDGHVINGDGWHYYQLEDDGTIIQAFEFYERDDGTQVVSPLPEMLAVSWLKDLGFDDWEALDIIKEFEFERIRDLVDVKS